MIPAVCRAAAARLATSSVLVLSGTKTGACGTGRENIDGIFGAQAYWPANMAANHKQALASYQFQGMLPQLAKEAMHVAASMTNGCEF